MGRDLADGLHDVLVRRFRLQLYQVLSADTGIPVSAGTVPLLWGLLRHGPQSASQLGREVGIDRSVASRQCTAMEQAGYLERTLDPDDDRVVLVRLTPAGRDAAALLHRRTGELLTIALADWTDDEQRQFAELLDRFITDVDRRSEELLTEAGHDRADDGSAGDGSAGDDPAGQASGGAG